MFVSAPGIDRKRQTYLYKHIRQFVAEESRDIMCPMPDVLDNSSEDEMVVASTRKKKK